MKRVSIVNTVTEHFKWFYLELLCLSIKKELAIQLCSIIIWTFVSEESNVAFPLQILIC